MQKRILMITLTLLFTLTIIGAASAANDPTSLTLTVNPNPVQEGQQVTLSSTLTDTQNNGKVNNQPVNFKQDGTVIATRNTNGQGLATYTYTPTAGTHNIQASYNGGSQGNTNYLPSNSNTVTLTVNSVTPVTDLAVTKSDNPDPVTAGNQLTYTITVNNNGPTTVNSFLLTDPLPTGFNSPVYTPSSGSYNSATGIWTGITLTSGQSVILTIVGTVDPAFTGTSLSNTVTVTPAGCNDPTPGNNQATTTTTVNRQSNLVVTKTDSPDPVIAGNLLTYAMSITNNGPSLASIVSFRDSLPAALTNVQYSVNNANWFTYTSLQEVGFGNLNVGQTVNFWIRGIVDASTLPGSITNTVTSYVNGIQNNQASATTTVNTVADVTMTKTSNGPINVGQTGTFTITVTNNGPNAAQNVIVNDALPSGFTYVASPGTSYNSGTGVWTIGTLANGASVTLTFTRINMPLNLAGTTIPNTATETQGTYDPTPVTPQTANLVINPAADVTMTKTSNGSVYVGQTGTFTITVTNNGPSTAQNVVVNDALPAGFTYLASTGTSYNPGTSVWTIGNLANGGSATLTFSKVMQAGDVGTIPNTATETQNTYDPTPVTPQTANLVVNPVANVVMTKTGNGPINVGQTGTFTITVTNNGPNAAQNVQVTDAVPEGFTLGSFSAGNYVGNVWTIPSLANGESATLTFNRVMTAEDVGTTKTNTATETQDTYDPTPVTPKTATIYVNKAVLTVTKTTDRKPAVYNVGENVKYTINVSNEGNLATGVVVTDTLPNGLTFISATNGGIWDQATRTITWNVGDLVNDFTATVNAKVTSDAAAKTLINTLKATDDQMEGTVSTNASIYVPSADLVITKTVDNPNPKVNDTIHFTMIVNNHGPDTAVGVQVADKLPAGLSFVSYTANYGTYDPVTGIWNIGNLPNGASAVITITSIVEKSGIIVNEAKVTSITYDPNLEGNTARATINASVNTNPVEPEANAASNTVPMQETGLPIGMLVLAIMGVLGGFIGLRRN